MAAVSSGANLPLTPPPPAALSVSLDELTMLTTPEGGGHLGFPNPTFCDKTVVCGAGEDGAGDL